MYSCVLAHVFDTWLLITLVPRMWIVWAASSNQIAISPSTFLKRPVYSLDEGVKYNWRAGLKLITLLTPGTHWQLEIDLSTRAWFANELPRRPALPFSSPPLCYPPFLPFLVFSFLVCVCECVCVRSVPRSSFYTVPWQMLCRAAIVSHQFFWGCEESQKISTCDFNTGVPPAIKHWASFFVYHYCNLHSFGAGRNVVGCHCLSLNNGAIFLWLSWVIIGRYEKDRLLLRKTTGILAALCVSLFPFAFHLWLSRSLFVAHKN